MPKLRLSELHSEYFKAVNEQRFHVQEAIEFIEREIKEKAAEIHKLQSLSTSILAKCLKLLGKETGHEIPLTAHVREVEGVIELVWPDATVPPTPPPESPAARPEPRIEQGDRCTPPKAQDDRGPSALRPNPPALPPRRNED